MILRLDHYIRPSRHCSRHGLRRPSFTVSQERQSYYCFGCGVGGSVFRFVMDSEHLDFPSAAKKLAARAGIRVIEEPADL